MTRARLYSGLGVLLALCFAPAVFGSIFSPGEWYEQLRKPMLNPPNWVFGPVWTLLYTMMAISAWLIWSSPGLPAARIALILFLMQLVLNATWSLFFFGLHAIRLALLDIIILWMLILATLLKFWRLRKVSGVLLIPYLFWVSFAVYLNTAIWRLNP